MIAASIVDMSELSMIARWRKEYEHYRGKAKARTERREAIVKAVRDGYDVLSEIVSETGIPPATARRDIIELVGKNKLQSAKTKNVNKRIELRFELC